jgi:hypothetical protein
MVLIAYINVSEEHTAVIFKIEGEEGGEMYLRNLGTHLVHYTVLYPKNTI